MGGVFFPLRGGWEGSFPLRGEWICGGVFLCFRCKYLVLDVHEEEAFGWDAFAGTATVFGLDDAADVVDGQSSSAYFNKRSNNGSYHVAQEAVGCDGKAPLMGRYFVPMGSAKVAEICLDVGAYFREAGEVCVFEHDLCCFVHLGEVELEVDLPAVRLQEGVFAGMDEVVVGSFRGREACMHVVGYWADVLHGDVWREEFVERVFN